MRLPVIELPGLVPFPGIVLSFPLQEAGKAGALRRALHETAPQFVAVLGRARPGARLPRYGTAMALLTVEEGPDGTIVTAAGRERLRLQADRPVRDSGTGRALPCVPAERAPLIQLDPNVERLAAWDAATAFRRYSRRFYPAPHHAALCASLPGDPVRLSAFICMNSQLEPVRQYRLLSARSLLERLEQTKTMLQHELRRAALEPPGSGLVS